MERFWIFILIYFERRDTENQQLAGKTRQVYCFCEVYMK